jgi:hypothetical protein
MALMVLGLYFPRSFPILWNISQVVNRSNKIGPALLSFDLYCSSGDGPSHHKRYFIICSWVASGGAEKFSPVLKNIFHVVVPPRDWKSIGWDNFQSNQGFSRTQNVIIYESENGINIRLGVVKIDFLVESNLGTKHFPIRFVVIPDFWRRGIPRNISTSVLIRQSNWKMVREI